MQFMLRRAQDFAAASKTLVSATVSNKGTADITATSGKIVSSDNPPVLDKVFTNNIISIYRPYKIILKDFLKLKNLYEPSPKERFASKLSQRSRKERIDELISN